MTGRPFRAALFGVWGGLVLAAAVPTPAASVARGADGGPSPPAARDGGPARPRDGGPPPPLTVEDVEVIQNLDLLEHLPETEVLDLLLLAPDQ